MTETQSVTDKHRAASRLYYVKMHAPGILAALLQDPRVTDLTLKVQTSITLAGLLFDELEPK